MNIIAEGINDAWLQVVYALKGEGQESSPRGLKIKEIKNMSVEIKNPKKRILSLPIRNISLPFAFGELVWYLAARNDVQMMEYYSKMMKNFSDDGETLNSAYGYRIFGNHPALPFNQWEHVVDQLKTDPDTRQAVIHLHTPNNKKTKDEVCTLTLQFMIRDGKLDMITNMRSNDIVWGFTYDVFSFTTFQELIANELGIEVGTYFHNAASMHIYEKDFFYFDHLEIVNELLYMTKYDTEFSYDGLTIHNGEMQELFVVESLIRVTQRHHVLTSKYEAINIMVDIFNLYLAYKMDGKDAVVRNLNYDNIYHIMMRNYISRKSLKESNFIYIDGCDGAGKSTLTKKFIDVDIIAFAKPDRNFNKLVYFNTALLTGNIVLDRCFYSEWIYSKTFNRYCIISNKDIEMLERILNYRNAQFIFMNTDPETCFNRLDEEDSKYFSKEHIADICLGYELNFRVSRIKNKKRYLEVK